MLNDWGLTTSVPLSTDASATKAMTQRQGVGRTKHIEIQHLWVQEKVSNGMMEIVKIGRDKNMADLLTHHWTIAEGARHLPRLGCVPRLANETPLVQQLAGVAQM